MKTRWMSAAVLVLATVLPALGRDLVGQVQGLESRLTALRPENPKAYLLLGEEVLQEAQTAEDRQLAKELFVLAIAIANGDKSGHAIEGSAGIGASACLALASMIDDQQLKRWLLSVGASLTPDAGVGSAASPTSGAASEPAALDLATALGLIRSGEGRKAERLLDRPGVSELLEKMDKVIAPGVGGGASRVRTLARQYPWCPQCRNRRTVKNADGVHVCPACEGVPGPPISLQELVQQLRAESILLSGQQRTWAAQIVSDDGAPLRDLEPGEVAAVLRVDPNKTVWRNNAWANPNPGPLGSPKPGAPPGPASNGTPEKKTQDKPGGERGK